MTYFTEIQHGFRTEIDFDSKRFLADIAGALGGSNLDPEYQGGTFEVGELRIYLRAGYGAKARRVTVSCGVADRDAHRRAYACRSLPDFPSITVDPDRPLETVAKDIKRRVIDAAGEALDALKVADQAQASTFASLKAHADRLNALYPGLVTLSDDDTKRDAPLYLNGGGTYLSGRLTSEGAIYVDRLGTVPAAKVEALLALLKA